MVEVFITDIRHPADVKTVAKNLHLAYPEWQINLDPDETGLPYPAGHTVLRIEGRDIDPLEIQKKVNREGFNCEIMEDQAYS
ncbi:hypothetical protein KFE98_14810 [bacterium SCSIO 12741]|nr:hypothetical protein KFE98_14810 [bacterium SCSIO 12741]